MIVDFTPQTGSLLWVLFAVLPILAIVLFASLEPELAEVYLGEIQVLVATLALAAIAIAVLASGRAEMTQSLGNLMPGR